MEPALKAIFSNLNTNICREHLKMPLEKVREFDVKCTLYLAKRPGRSLKEKLCDNRVLDVKRYENANTHENRFLKRFIKELLRIVDRREIELQQVFEELIFSIKSFLKSGVAQQIDEKQAIIPNNLLHCDKHYKRILKAHDWLYNDVGSLMNLDQIFYLEFLYQAQFYTSIKIEPTLIRNEQDLYALIKNIFPMKDLSFEKMRLKAKEFLENELKQPINLDQEIPQLELCKGVYKEMYIDMFSPEPFALLVGNDNEEKILKLPLLAKKQEDNIYINANGAKGEIDEKGYLANALKDYDETLVEAFMRDFKERYKIERLYYLLDDNIENFEFAKIKHKISLHFKDAKFYPKSVALGISFLFENKLNKLKKYDDCLHYKKGKSSDLFEWVLEHLEILKDLNSAPGFFLKRGIKHLEKKLECGGISTIRKDKNHQLFYIVETDGKKVFCHSNQCEESVNKDELSLGARVCLEVFPDRKDPSKYQGKIYGLEENKEIILLNTAKNNYQRKPLDEKIKHRIEALKNIKYPCLKIFSHYTLEELETLNPEFATPFKEYLKRLEKYYFDPQTDGDFKKGLLDFFSRLNDSIPEKLQQEFIELPMDFLLSRCLGSLEKDFQKTIVKNLKAAFFNPKIDQEICFKILSIVARASWNNEKFLKNLMAQTNLEQQKGFLKRIEECLENPKPFYFSSACELLLAFLSYRNAKRELELIPESERTMRLLDSIDKAIEKEIEIKSFVKLELKHQRFNNIQPLLLALRLYLRGGFGRCWN